MVLAAPVEGVAVGSVVATEPVDSDCDTASDTVVGETDVSEADGVDNCRRNGVRTAVREGIYVKYE